MSADSYFLLTSDRKLATLLDVAHRRADGRQIRDPARHAGPDGAEDPGGDGVDSRVWHRAAHRADQPGDAAGEPGHDLSVPDAADAEAVDRGGGGATWEQSGGAGILVYQGWG